MIKNNIWENWIRFGIYLTLVLGFFISGAMSARFVLAQVPMPTGTINPSDPSSLESNPPFEIYGVTCGKADTLQNKCCVNKSLIPLDSITNEEEMQVLINKIDSVSSTNPFTNQELDTIVDSLKAYVNREGIDGLPSFKILDKLKKGENISTAERALLKKTVKDGFVSNKIQGYVKTLSDKLNSATGAAALTDEDLDYISIGLESSPRNIFTIGALDDITAKLANPADPDNALTEGEKKFLYAAVEEGLTHYYDTIKDVGPARLMARQMFTPDKCLVKTRWVKLCIRGTMEFFAGLVDKVGLSGALKDSYKQTKFAGCEYGIPSGTPGDAACVCNNPEGLAAICGRYLSGTSEAGRCSDCINNKGGFWTSLGCIGTEPGSFAQSLLGYGLSIGGTFSLLCIFYAAFVLQTSRGNPEKIKKAKENLRACITGLILIIFSILIVRLIGVDLLRIPGFN